MGNVFATLVLLLWIPLGAILSTFLNRQQVALIVIVGGALLLPEGMAFDAPGVPAIDKYGIACLSAFLGCWVLSSERGEDRTIPRATRLFAFWIVLGTIGTTFTNRDPYVQGVVYTGPMSISDGVSTALSAVILTVVPYFLGQVLFGTPQLLKVFVRGLVVAGLLYLPLVLFEARFSPLLNVKLYGYFQHDFIQMMREGGFRPIVFMSHALPVALLMSQSLVGAICLPKDAGLPIRGAWASALLGLGLIACKSLAAMIYTAGSLLLRLTKPATQARTSQTLGALILLYPILRLQDLFPTDWLLTQAGRYSAERAASLQFRFINEDLLLAHAQERILFGWGSFGRNFISDPVTGRPLTVVDGEWILCVGTGGWVLFFTTFLALLLPVFRLPRALHGVPPETARLLSLAGLLLVFSALDLLPNSLSHPIPFMLAGALTSASARARQLV